MEREWDPIYYDFYYAPVDAASEDSASDSAADPAHCTQHPPPGGKDGREDGGDYGNLHLHENPAGQRNPDSVAVRRCSRAVVVCSFSPGKRVSERQARPGQLVEVRRREERASER